MRSASRLFCAFLASAAFVGLAADCVEPPRPLPVAQIPTVAPPPSSAPAPTATASANAPPAEPPAAWNDAAIVAELTKDCRWRPDEDAPSAPAFSCVVQVEPSGDRDQCDERADACNHGCENTCGSCSEACMTACDGCKVSCRDDACKAACAKTTGDCKQACLGAKERCSTGGCADAWRDCTHKLSEDWKTTTCKKFIPQFKACVAKCPDADYPILMKCQVDCITKTMPKGKDCDRFFPWYRVF